MADHLSPSLAAVCLRRRIAGAFLLAGVGATSPCPAADTLNYGYSISSPVMLTEPLYYAEKIGALEREGLVVNVLRLQSDSLAITALLSGNLDVAWVGTTAAIQAIRRGARFKIIYSPVTKAGNVILANSRIASLDDLKGASIAVSALGSLSYDIPRIILQRNHIDPDSAHYIALGSTATRYQALVARKVDAAMVDLELASEAASHYDYLHVVASVAEQVPDLNLISVIADDRVIAAKPEALAHLARAEVAGERFAIEHPERAAEMSLGRVSVHDKNILVEGFETAAKLKFFGLDGGLDAQQFTATVRLMRENGELPGDIGVDQILTRQIVERAGLTAQ